MLERREIEEIFHIAAKDNVEFSKTIAGDAFIPYEENEQLQRYVQALAEQSAKDYVNMSQNTAFLAMQGGKKVLTSMARRYTDIIDEAILAVTSGQTDFYSAMRRSIKEMADSGIRTKYSPLKGTAGPAVDYATGYSRRLDTAVRQNILWGVKQCSQGIQDRVGNSYGADGYEIDYHSNPRPSHAKMGGKQYHKGKGITVNGKYFPPFSQVEDLLDDYGCLHRKWPIICGVSVPAHDDEELAELKKLDNVKIEFEGEEYTRYEMSQIQRKIETRIRHAKDRQIIAAAAGDDELRRKEQEKINLLKSKYVKVSAAAGLPTKMERMSVRGYHRVKTVDELKKKGGKVLQKDGDGGTISVRGMMRKSSNIGAFSSLQIPMQKKEVLRICRKYNIDTTGLKIKIQRSEDMLGIVFCGSTDYDSIGRIDLFPNAFKNEDDLIRTIIHEKCHVRQLQKYGKMYCMEHIDEMETEAHLVEEEEFHKIKNRGSAYE